MFDNGCKVKAFSPFVKYLKKVIFLVGEAQDGLGRNTDIGSLWSYPMSGEQKKARPTYRPRLYWLRAAGCYMPPSTGLLSVAPSWAMLESSILPKRKVTPTLI